MTSRRQIAQVGLWVGLLIVGAILAIQPQMAPSALLEPIQDITDSIEAIGSDEVSIGAIGIGVFLVIAGIGLLYDRSPEPSTRGETVSGKSPQTAEALLSQSDRSDQFRQHLQEMLARKVNDPDRQIQHGSWTDDPVAAATLSDAVEYPVEFRLLYWIDSQRAQEQAYKRTANAIARWKRQSEAGNDRE